MNLYPMMMTLVIFRIKRKYIRINRVFFPNKYIMILINAHKMNEFFIKI